MDEITLKGLRSLKRGGMFTGISDQQLLDAGMPQEEIDAIHEYIPSEEYVRLSASIENCNEETDISLLELSIKLAFEFSLICEDEYDDLLDAFDSCFDLRIVTHDGIQMVAAAVPFYDGKESMRSDGSVYMYSGLWINVFTGKITSENM